MIQFNEETHTYTLDGKEIISATQLMRKHGLSADYSGVSEEVLQKAADRGTVVHKEIEEWIETGEVGFTPDCASFVRYAGENRLGAMTSEQIVYTDICAGMIDLTCYNGVLDADIIVDYKKTANLNADAVSWQLSIYDYLSGKMIGKNAYIYDMAFCFHFDKDGNLKPVEINRKPYEEVDKLMECERRGEIYKRDTSIVAGEQVAKIEAIFSEIQSLEIAKKEQEEKLAKIKEALLVEMEKKAIECIETDTLKISYVAPFDKISLDAARFKNELPELAKSYEKKTKVKANLRITPKGDKK